MIKRVFALVIVVILTFSFYQFVKNYQEPRQLTGVSKSYVEREAHELGAMNLVTAIVVTYRGLDTLGEVSVLFIAATGVALLLRREEKKKSTKKRRAASIILITGARLLTPLLTMFGVYIFLHGHLTPGGGFQGGAVIASSVLLLYLARSEYEIPHHTFHTIESLSGAFYVVIGILGLFLAGGFLDNRILPLGHFGVLLSAGAIPIIYTFIGLKVGTELASIIDNLRGE